MIRHRHAPTWLVALLVTLQPCRAHESPSTAIYLKYTLQEDRISTIIECSTHLLPPLAHTSVATPPSDTGNYHAAIEKFLVEACPVTADGTPLSPRVTSLETPTMDTKILDGDEDETELLLAILSVDYPLERVPSVASITWTVLPRPPPGYTLKNFTDAGHGNLEEVFMTYEGFDGVPDFFGFTREDKTFVWNIAGTPATGVQDEPPPPDVAALQIAHYIPERTFSVPIASAVLGVLGLSVLTWKRRAPAWKFRWRIAACLAVTAFVCRQETLYAIPLPAGRPADTLEDGEAQALFQALHRNIYTSFGEGDEDAIYDVLSQSIQGQLLDRVYTEVYQSLIFEEADGTVARVDKVDLLASPVVRAEDGSSITVPAHWKIEGFVSHDGHTHRRTNQYRATYLLRPVAGLWKITGVEQEDTSRVLPEEESTADGTSLFPEDKTR